jgi:3-oxoacyl-[acyl-carrier protein] reductase
VDEPLVLISGGSRGLGLAFSRHLLRSGCRVRTFSRSATDGTQALEDEYRGSGKYAWMALDALDKEGLKEFVNQAHREGGHIFGLVNNAGINLDRLLPVTAPEEISKVISINLESLLLLTRHVTRVMIQKGNGSIVNVSSIIGYRGTAGTSVYSATKAGILGFTRSLARELGPKNIRVNALLPGYVDTDMTAEIPAAKRAQIIRRTPLGRLGDVSDVAAVAAFLLSPASSFITGQAIVVDGGLSC